MDTRSWQLRRPNKGKMPGLKMMEENWKRAWKGSTGMAVLMLGESGEGLRRRALPDRGTPNPAAPTPRPRLQCAHYENRRGLDHETSKLAGDDRSALDVSYVRDWRCQYSVRLAISQRTLRPIGELLISRFRPRESESGPN